MVDNPQAVCHSSSSIGAVKGIILYNKSALP